MKKVLLSAVTVLGVFGAFGALAAKMPTTTYGTIPSHVQMDTRPLPNLAQQTARNSAPAIQAVLAAAENAGYGRYESGDFDAEISEGSFSGMIAAPVVDSNVITFTFNLSEVSNTTLEWKLKYTPVLDSNSNIDGWTCVSNLGTKDLGAVFVKAQNNDKDPLLAGLGWPFSSCVVGTVA